MGTAWGKIIVKIGDKVKSVDPDKIKSPEVTREDALII